MVNCEAKYKRLIIRRLMEEIPTDEEEEMIYDDSESEIDFVEEREDGTGTELEMCDYEQENIVNDDLFFLGKDKSTTWMNHAPRKDVRTRGENKICSLPTSRILTRSLKAPTEIFKYFVSEKMIYIIVQNKNLNILPVSNNFEREEP